MNKFYDIKRLPENGTIVLPLSMPKLHGEQSPEEIYKFLGFIEKKIPRISVDVVFLYTNGLYFNSEQDALSMRIRSTNQMLMHMQFLKSIIEERYEFVPQAFHYYPWDYVVLNSPCFSDYMHKLEKSFNNDNKFRNYVIYDMYGREPTDANVRFILEELAIVHMINERIAPLPSKIADPNGWRLLAYQGPVMLSLAYLYQNKLLPIKQINDRFSHCHYDAKEKVLVDYQAYQLCDEIFRNLVAVA